MSGLFAAFMVESALITYRTIARGIKVPADAPLALPLPSNYVAPVLVFGVLGLAPGPVKPVAVLFGWGLVAATLLNLWQPGGANVKAAAPKPLKPSLPQPTTVSFG